ncbi:hypothetical protein [Sphingobacterium tabacisoli]|uniref:Uncharacterized protein n=1 Tax=Sphingobacterium tabacisoli TaxID=2044855 RepID=A0ABW5L7J4_9SPHI|nr:hypothetical protein [Sphingobacterium tabacisoli]
MNHCFRHSGRDWPVLFFRKKVHKKLVTVPACHKVFPYLQLATRQGDIFLIGKEIANNYCKVYKTALAYLVVKVGIVYADPYILHYIQQIPVFSGGSEGDLGAALTIWRHWNNK